jgi:uncharacterized protein DUF1259
VAARVSRAWLAALILFLAARPTPGTAVAEAVGRPGGERSGVYRVSFPRTDLRVTVDGRPNKPGFALGGWAAFARTGDAAVVDGDLVLLPQGINAVVSVLQANGLEITTLHNHLLETPQVMYLHFFATGDAVALARGLRTALAETAVATPPPAPTPAKPPGPAPEWACMVEQSLGRSGTLRGRILAIGVPRAEQVHEHGATLAPAMGMANAFAVQETESGQVAATGDFVLSGEEVNPVIRDLRAGGIQVTAFHNHLIGSIPALYFLHFWAAGDPTTIGPTFKQALRHIRLPQS